MPPVPVRDKLESARIAADKNVWSRTRCRTFSSMEPRLYVSIIVRKGCTSTRVSTMRKLVRSHDDGGA